MSDDRAFGRTGHGRLRLYKLQESTAPPPQLVARPRDSLYPVEGYRARLGGTGGTTTTVGPAEPADRHVGCSGCSEARDRRKCCRYLGVQNCNFPGRPTGRAPPMRQSEYIGIHNSCWLELSTNRRFLGSRNKPAITGTTRSCCNHRRIPNHWISFSSWHRGSFGFSRAVYHADILGRVAAVSALFRYVICTRYCSGGRSHTRIYNNVVSLCRYRMSNLVSRVPCRNAGGASNDHVFVKQRYAD